MKNDKVNRLIDALNNIEGSLHIVQHSIIELKSSCDQLMQAAGKDSGEIDLKSERDFQRQCLLQICKSYNGIVEAWCRCGALRHKSDLRRGSSADSRFVNDVKRWCAKIEGDSNSINEETDGLNSRFLENDIWSEKFPSETNECKSNLTALKVRRLDIYTTVSRSFLPVFDTITGADQTEDHGLIGPYDDDQVKSRQLHITVDPI